MKENPILSIIIPSYNVSKYVDECLPTFIDERFRGLLKIYLIDDGATDDTKEKIAPYVAKYPYIFEFIHKENGGHGSVINYGVKNCVKSKYFKVIDGDDWVDKNELFKLIKFLEKTDSDLIVCDYTEVYSGRENIRKICKKDVDHNDSLNNLVLTIHSVTFKSDIFQSNNIVLREHVFFEDNEYILFPLRYVKKVTYLPLNVYQYRLGTATQSVTTESRIKRFSHLEAVEGDLMKEYLDIKTKEPNNSALIQFENSLFYFFINDYIYYLTISTNKKEFMNHFKELNDRKSLFASIYKKLNYNKKFIIFKFIKVLPFSFVKKHLSGRFS